ncbi:MULTISPECIES: hypothetical protein [Legionella]|uniref:hypothetical protein n=1 Tax=Legionella TaxID=445 RepID=UPI000F8D5086|nr:MULTISPECIES: hypothetical protein [Legionella]MCP0912885.1 hypothetical protein [Legionella sp. 27cVA30]RUQ93501.1 hypothetical protein ELY11_11845 [Legionella septentrionalis]RUR10044.1 hypothetical protein ELY14_06655 [Legionella septentrionalis]RUR13336.1 hypothetical protein ELY10_10670 [Legionella septentrionalis]
MSAFKKAISQLCQSVRNIVFEKEGMTKYRKVLLFFISDGLLTSSEIDQLNFLKEKYSLSTDEINKIHKTVLSNYWNLLISDSLITEKEKQSFEELLTYFSLKTTDINFSQADFNKFYALGLLAHGVLVEIPKESHNLNICFNKEEVLHYGEDAFLCRIKKSIARINYSGISGSIKIVKGLRYKFGSFNLVQQVNEYVTPEDSGVFYITNQRIGFLGAKKQFTIKHSKIISFNLSQDGLLVFKEGKENPYILKMDDYEVIAGILSFIVNH